MPYREYYDKLSIPITQLPKFFYKLGYTNIEKSYITRLLFPYFVISFYIFFFESSSICTLFSIILLFVAIFTFSYFTHKVKFYLMQTMSYVFVNKKFYNISLNQIKLFESNKDYPNDILLFFTTLHHNNCIKKDSKMLLAFLHSSKEGIEVLKNYLRDKYYFLIISNLFVFSFIFFWALINLLTSIEIIKHHNIIFLLSGMNITLFLIVSYRSITKEHLNNYYKQAKNNIMKKSNCKFNVKFYLTKQPKEILEQPKFKKTIHIDIMGLVFGVLFSLYITLLYNTVYNINVNVVNIIDKNTTSIIKKSIYK